MAEAYNVSPAKCVLAVTEQWHLEEHTVINQWV